MYEFIYDSLLRVHLRVETAQVNQEGRDPRRMIMIYSEGKMWLRNMADRLPDETLRNPIWTHLSPGFLLQRSGSKSALDACYALGLWWMCMTNTCARRNIWSEQVTKLPRINRALIFKIEKKQKKIVRRMRKELLRRRSEIKDFIRREKSDQRERIKLIRISRKVLQKLPKCQD